MDAACVIDKAEIRMTEILSDYSISSDDSNNGKDLTSLKKGQLVTGTIMSVDENVTIALYDRNVTAQKNIFDNIQPGDIKTFEVVKVTDKVIELKLYDKADLNRRSFKVSIESYANWDIVMAHKDQAARKLIKEEEYKDAAVKLADIGARLTEQDFRLLEQEGFSVCELTVDGLYEALNRIKASEYRKDSSQDYFKSGKENLFDRSNIEAVLKAENIPVTKENVTKFIKALSLSEAAARLDDKAMRYLIQMDIQPTIENIYKAHYSGNTKSYPLPDKQWEELIGQASEVITEAGYEVTQTNLKTARWLLDNQLPLTIKTFSYRKELEGIIANSGISVVFRNIIEGMRKGIDPKDVTLLSDKDYYSEKLIQDINYIQPEAISEAVNVKAKLTISNLVRIQKSLESIPKSSYPTTGITNSDKDATNRQNKSAEEGALKIVTDDVKKTSGDNNTKSAANLSETIDTIAENATKIYENNVGDEVINENKYEEIKAQRQLEEIRLKMTLDAAATLERKGIKVETQELSKVVDALRELENSYYIRFFKEADVQASDKSIEILRDTVASVEQLKSLPSYVLGRTLPDRYTYTIPQLITEGRKLRQDLDRAGLAYEALMTVPSREYGDSIQKAFGNMSSLLSELGIENTEQNQKAVRILAYNRMEINEKSLRQVKAYDLQVSDLIKNLHPAVTVRLIKEGINPLDIPVLELNKRIDKLRDEQGIAAEERYSTFLRRLDKAGDITEPERKAYIGLYRLLYNVEKSDGAAIGAVLKAGREVTLENLLTAVQTGKKGKVDEVVNDEFGTLQGITRDREAISQQLTLFHIEENYRTREQDTGVDSINEQAEYYNRIIKHLKDEASPEKIKKTLQEAKTTQHSINNPEAALHNTALSQSTPSQDEIWEFIKDVPVEKLFDQYQNAQITEGIAEEVYQDTVRDLRQLCKNAEQSIRFLKDYNIPSTPINLMIAGQILSNGESPFKRIIRLQQEKNVGKLNNSVKEINNFTDKLVDKQTMEDAYTQLEENAKEALEDICAQEQTDSVNMSEYISLEQQFKFLRTLAGKEFYQIPVETDSGITSVNLTIIRRAQSYGELAVTLKSDKLGSIKVELSLKSNSVNGYISSDKREGLDKLKNNIKELDNAAQESAVALQKLDYVFINKETVTGSYRESVLEESEMKNPDTERILYSLAKGLLRVISLADNNEA